MFQQAVQDRQRKGCGLAGSGLGDADDVTAGQCERDGLGLDGGGRLVVFFLERARNGIGEAEILKGGQKRGFFPLKKQRPAVFLPGARGVSETPACLGRRFWSLKGQARNRRTGSEHAARKDLMIL